MPLLLLTPTDPLLQAPMTLDQKKLLVETEIERFDAEMRRLGNSALVNSELALIRTYLILKLTDRL